MIEGKFKNIAEQFEQMQPIDRFRFYNEKIRTAIDTELRNVGGWTHENVDQKFQELAAIFFDCDIKEMHPYKAIPNDVYNRYMKDYESECEKKLSNENIVKEAKLMFDEMPPDYKTKYLLDIPATRKAIDEFLFTHSGVLTPNELRIKVNKDIEQLRSLNFKQGDWDERAQKMFFIMVNTFTIPYLEEELNKIEIPNKKTKGGQQSDELKESTPPIPQSVLEAGHEAAFWDMHTKKLLLKKGNLYSSGKKFLGLLYQVLKEKRLIDRPYNDEKKAKDLCEYFNVSDTPRSLPKDQYKEFISKEDLTTYNEINKALTRNLKNSQ